MSLSMASSYNGQVTPTRFHARKNGKWGRIQPWIVLNTVRLEHRNETESVSNT